MAAVNVTFPGNLAQVRTADNLRSVPSTLLPLGTLFIVNELSGVFEYDPGSVAADNGTDVLRPDDKTVGQSGRWIFNAAGLAAGPPGSPGAPGESGTAFTGTVAESQSQPLDPGLSAILVSGTSTDGDNGSAGVFVQDDAVTTSYAAARPGRAFRTTSGKGYRRVPQADVADDRLALRALSPLTGAASGDATVLICGNSFGQGGNASNYQRSYAYLLPRSIINASPGGAGYHGVINIYDIAYAYPGSNTAGAATMVQQGIWGNSDPAGQGGRLNLASGGVLALKSIEADAVDVIINATASTAGAVLNVSLNGGANITTRTVSGTGYQSFSIPLGKTTALTDSLAIVATGGTIQIMGMIPRRTSTIAGPEVLIGARAGYAIQDYSSTAALDEMAFWLNRTGSAVRTALFMLGTNELYRAERALTPAAMVAQMEAVRSGLASRVTTGLRIAFSVPPQSKESAFPIQTPGFAFADYVRAFEDYALQHPEVALIRHDRTALSAGTLYADAGLHPGDQGHQVYMNPLVSALGIQYNPSLKSLATADTGAFTTFTPALKDNNGTIAASASACRYRVIDGEAEVLLNFNAALGSGFIYFQLPVAPTYQVAVAGFNTTLGLLVSAEADVSSGRLYIKSNANPPTYPLTAANQTLLISLRYPVAPS